MLVLVGAVALSGCSAGAGTGATTTPSATSPASAASPAESMMMSPGSTVDSKAADLRVRLDLLLGEHIILATKATGAALGGRAGEFAAYGGLLNTNGTDLGAMIGAAFGTGAQDQFNKIWSAHNGFFVDYTTGVATNDKAKADKAVNDL
ncbi:MAG: hypothetical protein M3Y88_04830, partial [Chloroflexota bacterium]|nr:hypothetical protein [Chloroflexota bacterium]